LTLAVRCGRAIGVTVLAALFITVMTTGATGAETARLGTGVGYLDQLPGDGRSHIAYRGIDGVTRVVDTSSMRVRKISAPATCAPVALAAGRVLLRCDFAAPGAVQPRIASIRGGTARPLPGWEPGEIVTRIGRHWVRADSEGHRGCHASDCPYTAYLDWRTGQRYLKPTYDDRYDLDAPGASTLRRRPADRSRRVDGVLTAYTRRVGVYGGTYLRVSVNGSRPRFAGLGDTRCCDPYEDGGTVRIGSGLITWIDPRRQLHVLQYGTWKRWNRRVSSRLAVAVPTRNGVVIAETTGPLTQDQTQRYRLRIWHPHL
jgi:hypothetical protein